jgi:hypothetical protein
VLLRRLRIHALDDLCEVHSNLLAGFHTAFWHLLKLLMDPHRFPSLSFGHLWLGVATIARRFIAVPFECIAVREEVPAVIAECDLQQMQFRGIAMACLTLPSTCRSNQLACFPRMVSALAASVARMSESNPAVRSSPEEGMRYSSTVRFLAHEVQPSLEPGAEAEPAHDHSVFPVVFCGRQQRLIALAKIFRDRDRVVLCLWLHCDV